MGYFYLKALHIIFIVTWFAGLFYVPRLFIYIAEAQDKPEPERTIVQKQLLLMSKRLWYAITWPSAILSLILGCVVWYLYFPGTPSWLFIKVLLVVLLYLYHYSLQVIYQQQAAGIIKYSGQQLRLWNEVPTILLVAIVMLVVVKENISLLWGIGGIVALIVVLMAAISIYKKLRSK